jgi:hypothetical protein
MGAVDPELQMELKLNLPKEVMDGPPIVSL